ncbi:hypothetical protein AJ78_05366 [Emergomyces pasteurianus Ep9510]|uniref:Uncharacterized protein n=1 Tax=Emergomyces pasteurianus Ep9510 TaxID=1447872 RepID=A0A1J9PCI9_9EURO|nr:hypothetical protein AJ78_05366 [Emergomyces pasteurianus Ep9510]
MLSPSTALSPPSLPETPDLLPTKNRLITNTTNETATATATVVSQRPIQASIVLSSLIPALLLFIYALYTIHRIRQSKKPFTEIKKFLHAHTCIPRNGKGRRGGNDDGYIQHINAECLMNSVDDCVARDELGVSASDDRGYYYHYYYGHNGLDGQQQRIDTSMMWGRISQGRYGRRRRHSSYQLIDIVGSDADTTGSDTDTVSDLPLSDIGRGFDNDHGHNHNRNRNHEQMTLDDGYPQGYACNHPASQKVAAGFDLSKYFDPRTSRLRDNNAPLRLEAEIGSNVKEEDGYIASWIHGSVDWVVAKFIGWLAD